MGTIAKWPKDNTSAGWNSLLPVFTEGGLSNWSLLTILLGAKGPLCNHESPKETGPVGSLSYLWCKAGRKVRTEHGPAPHRAASGSSLSQFGIVSSKDLGQRRFGEGCTEAI